MAETPEAPPRDAIYAVRGPDHRYIYSNAHRMRITGSDLSISFGVVGDSDQPDAKFAVYEQATIILSFTQMRLLASELNSILTELERLGVTLDTNPANLADAIERAKKLPGDVFKWKRPQN